MACKAKNDDDVDLQAQVRAGVLVLEVVVVVLALKSLVAARYLHDAEDAMVCENEGWFLYETL